MFAQIRGEVVLYQPNDTIRLEVKLEQETVWLTQQQIADLFGTKETATRGLPFFCDILPGKECRDNYSKSTLIL